MFVNSGCPFSMKKRWPGFSGGCFENGFWGMMLTFLSVPDRTSASPDCLLLTALDSVKVSSFWGILPEKKIYFNLIVSII